MLWLNCPPNRHNGIGPRPQAECHGITEESSRKKMLILSKDKLCEMLGGGQGLPSMEAREGWIFKTKITRVNKSGWHTAYRKWGWNIDFELWAGWGLCSEWLQSKGRLRCYFEEDLEVNQRTDSNLYTQWSWRQRRREETGWQTASQHIFDETWLCHKWQEPLLRGMRD